MERHEHLQSHAAARYDAGTWDVRALHQMSCKSLTYALKNSLLGTDFKDCIRMPYLLKVSAEEICTCFQTGQGWVRA